MQDFIGLRVEGFIDMDKDSFNALPTDIKSYIHDLETRCDPSGDVQTIHSNREQIAGLLIYISNLKKDKKVLIEK